jgi:ribosomal protein L37AE/L43A
VSDQETTQTEHGECPDCGREVTLNEIWDNDWSCPNCGHDPQQVTST